ncbi:MAG: hypothetical protein U0796_18125 [Gemmatales bacterium]
MLMRFLSLAILLLVPGFSLAWEWCPFCGTMQGQTLVKEVQQARFVLYGVPSNPQIKREADGREISTTEFTIEQVVKNDPFLKNKKTLTLPRYIPPSTTGQEKLLVFCDLNNDQADTYLYLTAKDEALVKYLKEAIQLDEKQVAKRLHFYFNYLDHFDNEIATDAFKEFGKAEYSDVVKMVKEFGGEQMRKRLQAWLKDPNTAVYRYGLLGLMLGLCGEKSDADVFLSVLNDPDKSLISGIDGLLAGYILVDKDAGWKYTMSLVSSTEKDFNKRYAALRTLRFLWETHIGHVPEADILGAVEQFVAQGDIADLAIEDLRKWKQWKFTSKIIEQGKRDTHIAPIVQRAILRYMLSVPGDKQAADYVAAIRKEHPDRIKDALEILELEKSSSEAAKEPSKAK